MNYCQYHRSKAEIIWADVQAQEELTKRGWRLLKCSRCGGSGIDPSSLPPDDPFKPRCFECSGVGEIWTPYAVTAQ